jgi:hypothetical protein
MNDQPQPPAGDPRLDRIPQFDEQSRNFPIREVLEAPTYRSQAWDIDVWLDQGYDGACVGFAWTHELIAVPVEVRNLNEKFAKETVYWEAQKIDPWPGGSYPGADPFYEGTSVLAGVKVCHQLGYFSEYRWAFGLDDLRLTLGNYGPVVIGINWYTGMLDTDAAGFVHPTGRVEGGHAILVTEVNEEEDWFRLHNSWGSDWGIEGDCKLSFADMTRLLYEYGEACVPVLRHDPNAEAEPVEPEKEEPVTPAPFRGVFGLRTSTVVHDEHRGIRRDLEWPSLAAAVEEGRRACGTCRPQ